MRILPSPCSWRCTQPHSASWRQTHQPSTLIVWCCISEIANKHVFRWVRVKFNAFLLIWDKRYLMDLGVKYVEATYARVVTPDIVVGKTVSVDKGKMLIKRLYPNSQYTVEVTASGDDIVLTHHASLKTLPPGKYLLDCIHWIALHACVIISVQCVKAAHKYVQSKFTEMSSLDFAWNESLRSTDSVATSPLVGQCLPFY